MLLTFVMNDNKILIANEAYRSYNSLLENTTVMNRSRFAGSITHIDENAYWIEPYLKELYSQGMRSVQGLYQYRIKDLVFHDFKHAFKQQGKLGNF